MQIDDLDIADILRNSSVGPRVIRSLKGSVLPSDVAVIGMSAQIADADNIETFWKNIRAGKSSIGDFPVSRRHDVEAYLELHHALTDDVASRYMKQGYLKDVDKFDYRFFGMSHQEANFIDPDQRLFLQTAWSAIEEAGYGGQLIEGSNTGVFVGLSNDFGEDYRAIVNTLAPDAPEIAIVGNIKSVIASRISYYLDLKGPSIVLDTACSSALVSLHLACKSIRSNECEMALAGTVKTNLIPIPSDSSQRVGMKEIEDTFAADNQTKTFDIRSDGMSVGEGVIAFVLKSYSAAIRDNDQIHCVIKGSAMNQDGKTIGLTAPSNSAQAAVIKSALKDANVHPDTISYIEAHGTGTKLGDPVEISGISTAFSDSTQRRQFCGIGSVKTNVGHLDNGAGLASLAKVAMSMKNRELPASLNFSVPNSNIAFQNSPVYVVDRLTPWHSEADSPLRAGISSFGLSGTNCHVVVQEYRPCDTDEREVGATYFRENVDDRSHVKTLDNATLEKVEHCGVKKNSQSFVSEHFVLPLSAKSPEALLALVESYIEFLCNTRCSSGEISHTASHGRWHYKYRIAIVFDSIKQLRVALKRISEASKASEDISPVCIAIEAGLSHSNTAQNKKRYDTALRYANGENIDWNELVKLHAYRKVSVPTYPFEQDRCWVNISESGKKLNRSRSLSPAITHPLLDRLIAETDGLRLYETVFSAQTHWMLAEHKVHDRYVLPGTCYVEMFLQTICELKISSVLKMHLHSIQFLAPMALSELSESLLIHTKIVVDGMRAKLHIVSSDGDGQWTVHAEAIAHLDDKPSALDKNGSAFDQTQNVRGLQVSYPNTVSYAKADDLEKGLVIGDRWTSEFDSAYANSDFTRYLIEVSLPQQYAHELGEFYYHPALFDTAINAANHLIGDGSLYLPLSYQNMKIRKSLPQRVFVHLSLLGDRYAEVVQFEIHLLDDCGEVCAWVEKYSVKKLASQTAFLSQESYPLILGTELSQYPGCMKFTSISADIPTDRAIAFIYRGCSADNKLQEDLVVGGFSVTTYLLDDLAYTPAGYSSKQQASHSDLVLISALKPAGSNLTDQHAIKEFYLTLQAVLNTRHSSGQKIVVLTMSAHSEAPGQSPIQSAISAMVQVAAKENPQIRLTCVDVDTTQFKHIPDMLHQLVSIDTVESLYIIKDDATMHQHLTILSRSQQSELTLTNDGIYIVSGGSGALGLELVDRLASIATQSQVSITLVLVGKRKIPEAHQWRSIEDDAQFAPDLRKIVIRLNAICNEYVKVVCLTIDADTPEYFVQHLNELRTSSGAIKGVFHLAGVAGEGFMRDKSTESLQSVLSPKVDGYCLLNTATQYDKLDWFVSFSSINSISIEAGQTDYAAANRYLDSAMFERCRLGKSGLSIRWPAWSEVGMAVTYDAVNHDDFFSPINTHQALDSLIYCMSRIHELPPVVTLSGVSSSATMEMVYSKDLYLSERMSKKLGIRTEAGVIDTDRSDADVVILGSEFNDDIVVKVANIWSRVLLASELNVDDAFIDLGGNSILTAQLYKEFEKEFPGTVDIAELFTYITIRSQAELIRKAMEMETQGVQHKVKSREKVVSDSEELIVDMLANGDISLEEAQARIQAS